MKNEGLNDRSPCPKGNDGYIKEVNFRGYKKLIHIILYINITIYYILSIQA